jgi:hypothetical protein
MLIEARFDIAFECSAQTPMLLQLNLHPSRDAFAAPDRVRGTPLAMRAHIDHLGNLVIRGRGSRGARRISIASSFMTRANPMKRRPTWI